MDKRLKQFKWNSSAALVYQIILVVSGLILPRFYLLYYGTAVNGLISSITQFLALINLCDFGISAVVTSALYRPLSLRDSHQISRIFLYARHFFRRIGVVLCFYVAALLVIYPLFVSKVFGFWDVFFLLIVMSISQFAQYFVGLTYQILLSADQRSYVQLSINGITLLCNTLFSMILMVCGCSIQVVKLFASLIYLFRPLLMYLYVRRHYRLSYHISSGPESLPQKWNGVIQHVSYIVYENTDILLLTMCSTLENVSIYTVYTLATKSIRQIITAASTGVEALFGNMIAQKETLALRRAFLFYDWCIHTVATALFTAAGVLIVPFVMVYTKGVHDADYRVPLFAALITFAYFLNVIRNGMYVLIRAAGHYRQTQTAAMVEALLNFGLSLFLVSVWDLVGVAIGTIFSTLFFTLYQMHYLHKNIVSLPRRVFVRQILTDLLGAAIMFGVTCWIHIGTNGWGTWIWGAVAVTAICLILSLLMQLLFYPNQMHMLCQMVQHPRNKEFAEMQTTQQTKISVTNASGFLRETTTLAMGREMTNCLKDITEKEAMRQHIKPKSSQETGEQKITRPENATGQIIAEGKTTPQKTAKKDPVPEKTFYTLQDVPLTARMVITLIKSALCGQAVPLPDVAIDWNIVYHLAKQHQIFPLLYEGMYLCGMQSTVQERFLRPTAQCISLDQAQNAALHTLCGAFAAAGVDYAVLKGARLKALYPKSEMRVMSDIDILIRVEQYDIIRPVMIRLGYTAGRETLHELPWYGAQQIHVELHKMLIPPNNEDYCTYWKDGWRFFSSSQNPMTPHEYVMKAEDEFLYLLTHVAKHYRDGGIGIKHVVDLSLFLRAHPHLDVPYLTAALTRLGLYSFYQHVCAMRNLWFEEGTEDAVGMMMTRRIIESGAYGTTASMNAAFATRLVAQTQSVAQARCKNLLNLMFLPYSSMQKRYPVLKKCPPLLPVFWIVRWVQTILFHPDAWRRVKKRQGSINAKKVHAYQDELQQVGLSFGDVAVPGQSNLSVNCDSASQSNNERQNINGEETSSCSNQ